MNFDKKKKFIIDFTYFALWIIIIFLLFKIASIYLLPFLIGIFIAYLMQKPAVFLSSKTKVKHQYWAAFLSVTVFIIIVFIFFLLGWMLFSRASELLNTVLNNSDDIKQYFVNFYLYFEDFFNYPKGEYQATFKKIIEDTVINFAEKISALLSRFITHFIKSLPSWFISCTITVIATCYMSKDFNKLTRFVKGFINEQKIIKLTQIKIIFFDCFFKFLVGYIWLFIITLVVLLFGFYLLKIKHFIIIAFFVALLDLLPVLGTGTILLPWSVFMFFTSNYRLGVGLIVLYLITVLVKNYTEPKIIGNQIGLHPLFTLIFIFVGLKFGGVLGMLFLPMFLTVMFTYYRQQITHENSV